jgi:hypothetical protein
MKNDLKEYLLIEVSCMRGLIEVKYDNDLTEDMDIGYEEGLIEELRKLEDYIRNIGTCENEK